MPNSTATDTPSLLIRLREELLRSPTNDGTALILKEARQALLSSNDARERAGIRHILAQYHSLHADFDLAHRILDEEVPEAPVDELLAASTAYTRATVFNRQRRLQDALGALAPYRNIHLEDHDLETAARIHTLYASLLDSLGETNEAYSEYRIAIELRERHGDPRGLAIVYYNFAESCLRRDEDDLALEFFIRAYDIEKGLGDHASLAQSACHIAIIFARRNNAEEALRFADEAMLSARLANMPMITAHVLGNRASVLQILGDDVGREKALVETLEFLQDFPIDSVLGPVLGNLGSLYLSQGKHTEAEDHFQRALEMSNRDGYQYNEGFWLYCLGQLRSEQGRHEEAIDYLARSVEILRSVKAHVHTLDAMNALAKAHASVGSSTDAFNMLAEMTRTYVQEHNTEMQSRLNSIQSLRIREKKEREEEIYRLKNVELSQALEAVKVANAELRELASEKDEFMAIAAHDLRNPLGDSRGMLQTIIGHYDVLDKSDLLSLCHDLLTLTMRMSNTVHAFLEITRTDRRSSGLVINALDLTLFAHRSVDRHLIRARAKSIALLVEIVVPDLWATGDASIVDAIVDNLVSNALKYIHGGSTIRISVDEDESGPMIRVCDNGPGVDTDKQHLLFTKYATLGVKPTGGEESWGLGLYLAQRMATRMGARITYKTSPENGACFMLHLLR